MFCSTDGFGPAVDGRNPAALLYTVPGVTDAASTPAAHSPVSTVKTANSGPPSESAPTVNGVRPGGTYFSLDGASNVDQFNLLGGPFPNPDATQEFGVVTGTYGARYVSAPGGAVNIVTKSGTNQFHGLVFEFIRNGYFNARNYFAVIPDTLKRNQFGFAVGGPVLKDRLFFFGSFQASPIRNQSALSVSTPSAAERMGQFTSLITGQTVNVPQSTVIKNLFKYLPLPGLDGFAHLSVPANSQDLQGVVKVDYTLGQHRLFARYFRDDYSTPTIGIQNNNFYSQSAGLGLGFNTIAGGDTWASKSGRWISDLRVSYLDVPTTAEVPAGNDALSFSALSAKNFTAGVHPGLGVVAAGFVAGSPAGNTTPRSSLDVTEDVTHLVGKHEISFGADYRHLNFSQVNEAGQNGVAIFAGLSSLLQYGPLNDNTNADLVMGNPLIFIQGDGFVSASHGNLIGVYGEDKFKASERLSLTGGLRWDPYFPFTLANGHVECFVPGRQSTVYTNAPLGLIFPGDRGCSPGGTTTKLSLVQPRIGAAYRLDSKGDTAVRAGFGIYATQFPTQSFLGFSSVPFVRTFQEVNPFQSIDNLYASNGLANPFSNGFQDASYVPPANVSFAAAQALGFSVGAIDKDFRPATINQYTLSLQHAFTPADSFELAYVGTLGVHISQSYDINLPVFGPGASASNEMARRPYGSEGLAAIRQLKSNATSHYNGLNATFRRHARSFDLVSAFNFSKCIDDDSSAPPTTEAATAVGSDPKLRRGVCDFDQTYSFRTTLVWNAPKLSGMNRFVRNAAGSWIVSALVVDDAGQPFSITDASHYSYTGLGLDYADRVPGQPAYVNGRLNFAAFKHNAPGTYGNSGRNAYRSPANVDTDLGLMKLFPIFRESQFMFRAEAFNIFNHPNYYTPNASYSGSTAATFGANTAARDPRILQFSAKVLF